MARQNNSNSNALTHFNSEQTKPLAEATNDVEKVREALQFAEKKGFNVLAPPTFLSSVPPDVSLAVKVLHFSDRDWYRPAGSSGYAPHKTALNSIADAIGVQWEYCRRVDNRSDPFYCEFEAAAWVPDPSTGEVKRRVATYALDVRDGSQLYLDNLDKNGEPKTNLKRKRQHIVPLGDTGARLRVIRDATGMRGDYTSHEIKQPFAVACMIHRPGQGSASAAQIVGQVAGRAAGLLYGPDAGQKMQGNPPPAVEADSSDDVDFPDELTAAVEESAAEAEAVEPPPVEGFPEVEEFKGLYRARHLELFDKAIEASDLAVEPLLRKTNATEEAISAAVNDSSEIPPNIRARLYELALEKLAAGDEPDEPKSAAFDYSDEDIPF